MPVVASTAAWKIDAARGAKMAERLIVLGAGATAALSERFPVGKNFFCSNPIWKSKIRDYPHLALALRKVNSLEVGLRDSPELTRVWLFLDTLLKYHSAIRLQDEY